MESIYKYACYVVEKYDGVSPLRNDKPYVDIARDIKRDIDKNGIPSMSRSEAFQIIKSRCLLDSAKKALDNFKTNYYSWSRNNL